MKLFDDFPPIATADWEDQIRTDLKGADYRKKLHWKTDEGIEVKPYYRAEDLAGLEYLTQASPGRFPFVRGFRTDSNDWAIREEIRATNVTDANFQAREALEGGADEVSFTLAPENLEDLQSLLAGIALDKTAVHFRVGTAAAGVLDLLESSGTAVRGSVDFDPLGDLAAEGASEDDDVFFERVEHHVRCAPSRLRVLAVRAGLIAEAGGTAVQELGFGLAHAAEYVAELTSRGLKAEQAADAITLHLTAGPNYFLEIAKFRAARLLYARMVEAFGVADEESCRAVIAAYTNPWNLTLYDRYVNVLRGTTEAMAAAIGGCDAIRVAPFDAVRGPADGLSRRLARNTQIILKREAWFGKQVDPAGGAYFFEVLTDALARESWTLFQRVEAEGGYLAAQQSGLVQSEVARSASAKEAAVASRRAVLVGTNQYPDQAEQVIGSLPEPALPVRVAAGTRLKVQPLIPRRAAEAFERIRLRTERHAAAGGKVPRFFLLEKGDVRMSKARSNFIANFLGCGGFETTASGAMDGADAIVLCSSDEEYPALAAEVCPKSGTLPVLVAGYPKASIEALKAAGVAGFLHLGSDPLKELTAWQDRLGVAP